MSDYQYIKQGDRLKKVRIFFGKTRTEWADVLFLRENSYGDFERGRSNFSIDLLKFLLKEGVNINWLLSGEGEMLLNVSDIHILHKKVDELEKIIMDLEGKIEAYKTLLKEHL